jgi:FKBP-type peptidyl-prolyl cis-trans isomerase 2
LGRGLFTHKPIERTNVNRSHIELGEGLILNLNQPDEGTIQAMIIKATEESVALDANRPLAGKDLAFEINLLAIDS